MEPIIEFGKNLFHSNRSVVGIGDIAFFVGTFIVYGFCMVINGNMRLNFQCESSTSHKRLHCQTNFNEKENFWQTNFPHCFYFIPFFINLLYGLFIGNPKEQASVQSNCRGWFRHICVIYPLQLLLRITFYSIMMVCFVVYYPYISVPKNYHCSDFSVKCFYSDYSEATRLNIAHIVLATIFLFAKFGELFYMFTPNKQQMSAESKPYFHCSSPIMDVPCMRCEGIKKKLDWWRQERPNMASGNIQCQLVAQNQSQSGNAASSIEVDVAKCKHLLKNSCYNARAGLAKKLDADGSASKLVRRCLTRDNARELLGHGYNDSALGFLTYISATKENVTVGYLQYLADSSFVQLHKKIAEATKSGISLNDSLYDIPYPWLEEFAATLSISKDGVNELLQPSWKILAGKAGIDITTILNLDKSATEMKNHNNSIDKLP